MHEVLAVVKGQSRVLRCVSHCTHVFRCHVRNLPQQDRGGPLRDSARTPPFVQLGQRLKLDTPDVFQRFAEDGALDPDVSTKWLWYPEESVLRRGSGRLMKALPSSIVSLSCPPGARDCPHASSILKLVDKKHGIWNSK